MEKPKINFETDRLWVRSIVEADKEAYMNLRVSSSGIAAAYVILPGFRDTEWENELNCPNEVYCAAFLKENQEFVACCSFQKFDTDTIELGLDVVEECRSQGIATELLKGMLKTVHDVFPGKSVKACTNVENTACRRMIEKCGGIHSGREPSPQANALASLFASIEKRGLDDEYVKNMQPTVLKFIDDYKEGICVYKFE